MDLISSKITFQPKFWEKVKSDSRKNLHLVLIGTKPDIIKQAPLVLELKRQNKLIILGHTGQHYDEKLNEDAKEIFGIIPDFNLNTQGSLYQKIGEIISRFGDVIVELKKTGKNILPFGHGDTIPAAAAGIGAYANLVAVVHVEAGLRAFGPKKEIFTNFEKKFNFDKYYKILLDKNNWVKGWIEPFPEQFDTRIAEPTAGLYNAPVSVNKESLLSEGFRRDRIFISGNSVADAVQFAIKKNSDVFKRYPILEKGFIRFAIHRRENVSSYHRFLTVFETMEELVKQKKTVLWLSHNVNKQAIKNFKLESRINNLRKKYPNFIYSDNLWIYDDNIIALSKASLNVTDSGSEQEETNILKVPSATIRFNSDRPETVWAGSNIIAPPISKKFLLQIIEGAENNPKMRQCNKLYGNNVSQKIIETVDKTLAKDGALFQWDHEQYGFNKRKSWRRGEINQL